MGLVVLVVGVIGLGAVIGAIVVVAVLRSRRNSGTGQISPSAGNYLQPGYLPQQPIYPSARYPSPSTQNQGPSTSLQQPLQ